MVLIRTVQQVAVEKERTARLHLEVNQFHPLEHLLNPLLIGPRLFSRAQATDPNAQFPLSDLGLTGVTPHPARNGW